MVTAIQATYEHGVLRPDDPLTLPEGSRVHLVIQPMADPKQAWEDRFAEFQKFLKEHPISSGGRKFTRDELYDRD